MSFNEIMNRIADFLNRSAENDDNSSFVIRYHRPLRRNLSRRTVNNDNDDIWYDLNMLEYINVNIIVVNGWFAKSYNDQDITSFLFLNFNKNINLIVPIIR